MPASPLPAKLRVPLYDKLVRLQPLSQEDFEPLYQVAADPLIWEQHPNRDRYKKEVFQIFFQGALESGGAYLIMDQLSGEIAGSTRLYDFDPENNSICIGYTFIARKFWGQGHNPAAKRLLLDHIFDTVAEVHFHIGAENLRSQIAIGRVGARKIGEKHVAYYGEAPKLNFIYQITRKQWQQ
ncbi:N-acetyltransferase [Pedobacter yulinensis]|uniref:N-acetyltransferase n=1 Tax=Pedobacter yulinensis TaxID=2126353 RepID=A0A2T3HMD2_9SPHI|nr:GNAT family N-acetyltransferase [Pedobacter yulinensis]PST83586.1 N-acetyltransferase [Pedobacter yulinensis]